jgi:signal transduction histidine kinase
LGSLTVGLSAHFDAIAEDIRSGKTEEALKWLKRIRKLFDQSVVRLKEMAIELRPPELDVLGLRAALRDHFSRVTRHGGIKIHFTETLRDRQLSADVATVLFRVAQEALTNAIKHGHAKKADVSLRASNKEVRLTVCDNGKGFHLERGGAQKGTQMGFRVMQEMTSAAGGAFTVDSEPGKATIVRVVLPWVKESVGHA